MRRHGSGNRQDAVVAIGLRKQIRKA
jgi:hypothetical protein